MHWAPMLPQLYFGCYPLKPFWTESWVPLKLKLRMVSFLVDSKMSWLMKQLFTVSKIIYSLVLSWRGRDPGCVRRVKISCHWYLSVIYSFPLKFHLLKSCKIFHWKLKFLVSHLCLFYPLDIFFHRNGYANINNHCKQEQTTQKKCLLNLVPEEPFGTNGSVHNTVFPN